MEIKKNNKISLCEYLVEYSGEKYYIEVSYEEGVTSFWLYNKEYGIKMFMYGIRTKIDESEIIDYIEGNIDEYITEYKEEYED